MPKKEKKKTLLEHSGDEKLDLIENSNTQTKMPEKKEKTLSVREPKSHKRDDGVKGRYSTRSTSSVPEFSKNLCHGDALF